MATLAQVALSAYARNFPLSQGKARVIERLWKPASFGQYVQEATLSNGVRIVCDIRQYLQRRLFFFGDYEPEYSAFWVDQSKKASVIFDVGANVGLYSLLAAKANSSAHVHAFEPTPGLLQHLAQHRDMNGFQNIEVNGLGVGAASGNAGLRHSYGAGGDNEGMNFLVPEVGQGDTSIKVTSLDEYCSVRDITQIDLMKIDVEGSEYDVLVGADKLLRGASIKCMIVEFMSWALGRRGRTNEELRSLICSYGFNLFVLREGRLIPLRETPDDGNVIAML